MNQNDQLMLIKQFVAEKFSSDYSGHDFDHMRRVAVLAAKIAKKEGGDPFLAEVCGWVHDLIDDKLTANSELAQQELEHFLLSLDFTIKQIKQIQAAIETVSFRKGKQPQATLDCIVQDADRLDAIGAIGIARAFSYGATRQQPLYADQEPSTLAHFESKLLKLKDLLNTNTAKQLAEQRHRLLEDFYHQFIAEWHLDC
ncbi:HD domain-containing protein [Amphibacillus sediminis]|uniref:HD domain-containing protein n=1 Tax=Amphibacillus sediminis TaxID=360185 RepID=UPI00082D7004|nr:HD domain-containing protein [Amphibacillus sediminis]